MICPKNGLSNGEWILDNGGNSELRSENDEESAPKSRVSDAVYDRENAMIAIDAELPFKNETVIQEEILIN